MEYCGFLDFDVNKLSCGSVCLKFVDKNETIKQLKLYKVSQKKVGFTTCNTSSKSHFFLGHLVPDAGRPNLPFWCTFLMFYMLFYSCLTKTVWNGIITSINWWFWGANISTFQVRSTKGSPCLNIYKNAKEKLP